jgi:hypothetical protein
MVKKALILMILLAVIVIIPYLKQSAQAESFKELPTGTVPEGAGECIATVGGWNLIEFWHYSGGYWKATTRTSTGLKEIIINDYETTENNWTKASFLMQKIYENSFVLEYTIDHPEVVIDAINDGKTVTPVMNIDGETIRHSGSDITPENFFNYDQIPEGLPSNLIEKPEYILNDENIIIRVLPKLNCQNTSLKDKLVFYPHRIPLVRPGFGSLSYSLFNREDAVNRGVGYPPDPYYYDRRTIDYDYIENIDGMLKEGYWVTVTKPETKDEPSKDIRIGYGTFANAGAVSIRFWYPIRIDYYASGEITPPPSVTATPTPPAPTPEVTDGTSKQTDSNMEPDADCVIKADKRGNEMFDVEQGIPVLENLYVNANAREYLFDVSYTEHSHSETEQVKVKKTWHLKWQEDHGQSKTEYCGSGTFYHSSGSYCSDSDGDGVNDSCPGHAYKGCRDTDGDGINDSCPGHKVWVPKWVEKTDTVVIYSDFYDVTRSYSYWTVDHFEAFIPESVTVSNNALSGGSIKIPAPGINTPNISLSHRENTNEHVMNDPLSDVKSDGTLKYDSNAACYVVEVSDGYLDGGKTKPSVPGISNPGSIIEGRIPQYQAKNDLLEFNGLTILEDKVSNTGDTKDPEKIPKATVCGDNVFFKDNNTIPDNVLNGIHNSSGKICYKRVTETVNPVYDSEINYEIPSINSVTVHTPVVCYASIIDDKENDQTLNPDDSRVTVVLGRPSKIALYTVGPHLDIPGYNDTPGGSMDCRKYTAKRQVLFPFDVYAGTDKSDPSCFVKRDTWYTIPIDAPDEIDIYVPTWVPEGNYTVKFREVAVNAPDTDNEQQYANTGISNYVAFCDIPVKVTGRIFGFKITDVSDILWWDVFRISKDSAAHTGNYYYVGTKDEEGNDRGISPVFTLPLVEGSHPVYKNRGVLKTGYTFKFELITIGGYYGNNDYISIIPEFWYVKKDGTGRKKVDLWYHDSFGGKMNYFVKISPDDPRNLNNIKIMKLGDLYRNVPEDEITDTSSILGIDDYIFKNRSVEIGRFDHISLSEGQRTFIGAKQNLPNGININDSLKSVQKWYGEYYLPNDLFAVEPDFDVIEYGRTHNGLDGKESFWLKDGYIIVNFRIEAVKNANFNNPILSYWGAPRCNMFSREGFLYEKTDYYGTVFTLTDGDIVFYDTNKRSSDDYRTGGTH